uniref:Helix-loop-helix DNA-binding domain containing protein n=1 Tax=Zea mays TaxID=4577 RepID=B6SSA8_MAIZE|nr:helix-loop-helix DNA-binding domain containing protein [Zea mays]
MQMDSYNYNYASFFHDEAPSFYPHVAVPPSPELPIGLIASPGEPEPPFAPPMPASFQDYTGAVGVGVGVRAPFGGASVHGQAIDALGGGDGQREQSMAMAEDGEEPAPRRRQPAGGPAAAAVESSRGFRHMMRERQRREKLSQSYADLHALVAARSRGDKNSIVHAAAVYIHELRGARDQLQRRNEELKARILGHDAGQQCVKVQFEVDEPASAIDSMIGALRRLKGMDVRARGIRSSLSGRRLWTEMNVETTMAADEVERGVEEALLQEVERKQQQQLGAGSAAPGFPGPSSHVQNVF